MITGRVVKLFSGQVTGDIRSEWLDCTNVIYMVLRVVIRNYAGFTNITPRIEGAFENPAAVALANDDILQTQSIGAQAANVVTEISFINTRQGNSILLTPYMSVNLDVNGVGSADVIVYAFVQEDIGN